MVPLLESLFNKVAGLQVCSFNKKSCLHKVFSMGVLRMPFLQNIPVSCF